MLFVFSICVSVKVVCVVQSLFLCLGLPRPFHSNEELNLFRQQGGEGWGGSEEGDGGGGSEEGEVWGGSEAGDGGGERCAVMGRGAERHTGGTHPPVRHS